MQRIPYLSVFFASPIKIFVGFLIFSFTLSISPPVKAEYYWPCEIGEVYWVKTPIPTCKYVHKKHRVKHVKHVKHVKKHYYHVPACTVTCSCCDNCCDYYNPDLTTGDDDPSIYPDLNIDR